MPDEHDDLPASPRSIKDSGAIRPVRTTRRSGHVVVALGVAAAITWAATLALMAARIHSPYTATPVLAGFALAMLLTVSCLTLFVDHRMHARHAGLAGRDGLTLREVEANLEAKLKKQRLRMESLEKKVDALTALVGQLCVGQEGLQADRAALVAEMTAVVRAELQASEDDEAGRLLTMCTLILDRVMPGYAAKAAHISGTNGASVSRLPRGG